MSPAPPFSWIIAIAPGQYGVRRLCRRRRVPTEPTEPTQIIVELRARRGIAVGQAQAADGDAARDDGLDLAAVGDLEIGDLHAIVLAAPPAFGPSGWVKQKQTPNGSFAK